MAPKIELPHCDFLWITGILIIKKPWIFSALVTQDRALAVMVFTQFSRNIPVSAQRRLINMSHIDMVTWNIASSQICTRFLSTSSSFYVVILLVSGLCTYIRKIYFIMISIHEYLVFISRQGHDGEVSLRIRVCSISTTIASHNTNRVHNPWTSLLTKVSKPCIYPMKYIDNYICIKSWRIITDPRLNFNDGWWDRRQCQGIF